MDGEFNDSFSHLPTFPRKENLHQTQGNSIGINAAIPGMGLGLMIVDSRSPPVRCR